MFTAAASASGVRLPARALTLRVADITTRVVCDDSALGLTVSDASSRFLVPPGDTDEPDVTTRVQRAPHLSQSPGDMLFDSGGTWRMYRERDDFVFSFVSTALGPAPYRLARFDTSFTRGTISFNGACIPNHAALAPLEFPLDELLMINLLARGRGVEVHGCGVIDWNGSAYLFAGQSEAGKSDQCASLASRRGHRPRRRPGGAAPPRGPRVDVRHTVAWRRGVRVSGIGASDADLLPRSWPRECRPRRHRRGCGSPVVQLLLSAIS